MNAPKIGQLPFDYTEFDYLSPEWWKSVCRTVQSIVPKVTRIDREVLAKILPDDAPWSHVARVGRSKEKGYTTILTTSAHVIQSIPRTPGNDGAIRIDHDTDAKGIALVMALYAKDGFTFTADKIPFGQSATPAFKDHVRKLWSEVQGQEEAPATLPAARPAAARSPAYV